MASFAAVVTQIALINLVFSIDSIVTAVGMANEIWVMAVAVILSMIVLMVASGPVASFVEAHPTVKVLALGFLIMIGMALVADAFGAHVPKGYIYTAMIFSVFIESINMVMRRRTAPGAPAQSLRRGNRGAGRRAPGAGGSRDGGPPVGRRRQGPGAREKLSRQRARKLARFCRSRPRSSAGDRWIGR